jgi:hypothetical protein
MPSTPQATYFAERLQAARGLGWNAVPPEPAKTIVDAGKASLAMQPLPFLPPWLAGWLRRASHGC